MQRTIVYENGLYKCNQVGIFEGLDFQRDIANPSFQVLCNSLEKIAATDQSILQSEVPFRQVKYDSGHNSVSVLQLERSMTTCTRDDKKIYGKYAKLQIESPNQSAILVMDAIFKVGLNGIYEWEKPDYFLGSLNVLNF